MASVAMFITRVLANAFPGEGRKPTKPSSPGACTPDRARVVGKGASNETHVTIDGIPHLFVDEGDCIVEFEPAFDDHTGDTMFGLKILPDLEPHWAMRAEHRSALKDAIATAIRRAAGVQMATDSNVSSAEAAPMEVAPADELERPRESSRRPARPRRDESAKSAAVVGRITWWGEDEFPDRRSNGSRFYKSFAIRLDTSYGERTLQGEGLKEAISEYGCRLGDTVSVKRLRKIKVPAMRSDGSPKIVNGQQVMWDKWLWSITQ
ncbi:conserved hypothetical protein (plasmid) [Burkholderia ambifaria MC40-6]|uniref:Uncharacterized protein n=1 Tax=Burkholderia ambifaria (strain MC40-6) TaxID=398577 RepID=B1Z693_BURA4|nr:hypothetical protein [Burkholderia ambifaria]ACB68970.1 conserved hypothetical protein [Burkholderia ambifaria MC40-6]